MKNTYGVSVSVTLFGESHGPYIGAVLDGLAPGIKIKDDYIRKMLSARAAKSSISTARREADEYSIVSGVKDGFTTGTPLCILIPNSDTRSGDYCETQYLARPGHADYTAECKYHGFQDKNGGGHFSGRITAALTAAGAICMSTLEDRGIKIATHISRCAGVRDREFGDLTADFEILGKADFPVLDAAAGERMKEEINAAKNSLDSVGGILTTAVTGFPRGAGEPWFDTLESELSHMLFSVPAVKGVEFGKGFELADMTGSEANDEPVSVNGEITHKSNNNGGIVGGISNGMPLLFSCAVKPTPSIAKKQNTVNLRTGENTEIEIKGRHDPAIVHRAAAAVSAAAAIVLCDMLARRYGTDYLSKKKD